MFKTLQINSTISALEMKRDHLLIRRKRVTSREFQGLLVALAQDLENQEEVAQLQLFKSYKKKTLQNKRKYY